MNIVYDPSVDDPSVPAAPPTSGLPSTWWQTSLKPRFTNPDTLNINVGWGVSDGIPVNVKANAQSVEAAAPTSYTYRQIYNALKAGAPSGVQQQADRTLPNPDAGSPFGNTLPMV